MCSFMGYIIYQSPYNERSPWIFRMQLSHLCLHHTWGCCDGVTITTNDTWRPHTAGWNTATRACIITAPWHLHKTFSQLESSFHWKLCCHWLKGLPQCQHSNTGPWKANRYYVLTLKTESGHDANFATIDDTVGIMTTLRGKEWLPEMFFNST